MSFYLDMTADTQLKHAYETFQASLYQALSAPHGSRWMYVNKPLTHAADGLFAIITRIGLIIENGLKGIGNIFGSLVLRECSFKVGVVQLTWGIPKNLFMLPFTVVSATFNFAKNSPLLFFVVLIVIVNHNVFTPRLRAILRQQELAENQRTQTLIADARLQEHQQQQRLHTIAQEAASLRELLEKAMKQTSKATVNLTKMLEEEIHIAQTLPLKDTCEKFTHLLSQLQQNFTRLQALTQQITTTLIQVETTAKKPPIASTENACIHLHSIVQDLTNQRNALDAQIMQQHTAILKELEQAQVESINIAHQTFNAALQITINDPKNHLAWMALSELHNNGIGTEKNPHAALKCLKQAAKFNNASANFALGDHYTKLNNLKKANLYFAKAAQLGDPTAHVKYAELKLEHSTSSTALAPRPECEIAEPSNAASSSSDRLLRAYRRN